MRLDLSEMIEWCMYLGHYEIPQTQWTRECLTRGGRFVDVGANFGHYTTLAASIVGPEGSIFAFEPSPRPAAVIEDAIAGNGLENVMLIRSALGRERGHADLYLPLKSNLYSPSLFGGGADYEPLRVPVIRLDEFETLQDGVPIDLIKIDAEGAEPDIIEGMTDLISKGLVKNMFCELNSGWLKRNNSTPETLFDRITELGFKAHRMTDKVTSEETPGGASFELQDIWFSWAGAPDMRAI